MFAVPGWSVSADKLKTQTERPNKEKKRERKREQIRERKEQVKKRNVGQTDLSEQKQIGPAKPTANLIPGNTKRQRGAFDGQQRAHGPPKKALKTDLRKERTNEQARTEDYGSTQTASGPIVGQDRAGEKRNSSFSTQWSSDEKATSLLNEQNNGNHQPDSILPAAVSSVKLTPLQSAMRAKLMGSRFRHLNESLYTKSSAESMQLFNQNPNFFNEYHAGFRQQVSSWPENPVDSFFDELEERSKSDSKQHERRPLPRMKGLCRIADLGCGDAALAKKIKPISKKCKLQVESYDLYSTEPHVIKADIANLSVASDSVNIAVLCLALMGTNWVEFIEEAWRILHWKGELWVAEIKSRFSRTRRRPPDHSIGKKRKPNKDELKKQKQHAEQEETEKAIAEMDGSEEPHESTDVTGFIAVLKARGFDLVEDNAIDISNKMFVRMKFVKNRPPVRGKYEGEGAKKRNWRETLREGEEANMDEAAVLQRCLYKPR